jgi:hypothetical protein
MLNCVVSFVKMFNMWHLLWHIIQKTYNLKLGNGKILHNNTYMQFLCIKWHNKCHILYIVMDETI